MGILTYGALLEENKTLNAKIQHLECLVNLVSQESRIQKTVIGQLKKLLDSKCSSKTTSTESKFCVRKHFMCKIDHLRFSWINTERRAYTNGEFSESCEAEPSKKKSFSYRRMSKCIDLLQAKYGMPSCQASKVFVGSDNGIIQAEDKPTFSSYNGVKKERHIRKKTRVVFVPRPIAYEPPLPRKPVIQKHLPTLPQAMKSCSDTSSECLSCDDGSSSSVPLLDEENPDGLREANDCESEDADPNFTDVEPMEPTQHDDIYFAGSDVISYDGGKLNNDVEGDTDTYGVETVDQQVVNGSADNSEAASFGHEEDASSDAYGGDDVGLGEDAYCYDENIYDCGFSGYDDEYEDDYSDGY